MLCPVCQTRIDKLFYCKDHEFEKHTIIIYECSFCNSFFVDKKTIGVKLSKYYENSYYERPGLLSVFLQNLRAKKFEKLLKGHILDVGCGSGFFLQIMHKKGWLAFGQEVSKTSMPYHTGLKEKGINFFYESLEKMPENQKFDLITLFHVIEHVDDPHLLLKKAKKLLKKNGILFIATPNKNSFSFKIFKCNWFHMDPPRHLIIYSLSSLKKILEQERFKVIKVSRFSFEYDPFGLTQSFYNLLGLEFNFLYKVLKHKKINSKGFVKALYLAFTIITIVPIFILSTVLSLFLGLFFVQDTIEVFAKQE